jgi:hypothetical protein
MPAPLSRDLIDALRATGGRSLEVIDPETSRTYVVVDSETHREAMEALHRQQDHLAIARGLMELDSGHGVELTVALDSIREKLGLRPRLP